MDGSDNAKRINEDFLTCFTYEKGKECRGASGRKLRSVCVYCPNYQRLDERSGSTCHLLKESNRR